MNKNSLVLAYLGDSVYELYVRRYLIKKGIAKVNELQKEATKCVSAIAQEKLLMKLLDSDFLSEDEINIIKRARNHKNNHKPKYASIITYKNATGLEASIGYLDIEGNLKRIDEIMNFILEESYASIW